MAHGVEPALGVQAGAQVAVGHNHPLLAAQRAGEAAADVVLDAATLAALTAYQKGQENKEQFKIWALWLHFRL